MEVTQEDIAKSLCKKLELQYPKTGEGKLMFAILELALEDITRPLNWLGVRKPSGAEKDQFNGKISAKEYFTGDQWRNHCELAGVNPEWVERLINKSGIKLDLEAIH